MLRLIVAVFSPWVERVGWERLRRLPGPVILAFNHGNSVESVVVPALLMAYREGRPIRFLVDWMYLRIPVLGWLLRQIDPIPVYTKPARWRLFERYRQRRRGASPVAAAVEALAAGHTIGLFPEGTRNASIDSLKPGRKGLGYVVLASEAPVVPVGIDHPARWRLGRMPKIGRMRVTVGEPLGFAYERAALRAAEGARAPRLDLDLLRRRLAGWVVERVIEEVYRDEKGWIENCEGEIAEDASAIEDRSWFLCRVGAEPVGLIRLAYDPPLELPEELDVRLEPWVDLEALARHRFVDLGRFMIRPAYRRLKQKNNKVFREVGDALRDLFEPTATALTA